MRDEKILVHCHAGCSQKAVLDAADIDARELFTNAKPEPREVAHYDYSDESGNLMYQVVRYEPKNFKQRKPDGRGGWIWNLNGRRRVLYGLPDVLAAESVLVLEGERDCGTARTLGFVATCNPGGAGK